MSQHLLLFLLSDLVISQNTTGASLFCCLLIFSPFVCLSVLSSGISVLQRGKSLYWKHNCHLFLQILDILPSVFLQDTLFSTYYRVYVTSSTPKSTEAKLKGEKWNFSLLSWGYFQINSINIFCCKHDMFQILGAMEWGEQEEYKREELQPLRRLGLVGESHRHPNHCIG